MIEAMVHDMGKAMAKGHRSIGHGLEVTRKNLNEAEENIRRGLHTDHRAAEDGIHLKPGQNVLKKEDLEDEYRDAVSTRIDGLRQEGHGPQRHLDPTDQMLKDRLGVPTPPRMVDNQLEYHRMEHGYVQTERKIDPAHGPHGKQLPEPDRYMDAEDPTRRHKCGAFSTAFKPGEDEAFMHAERYARQQLDLSEDPLRPVRFPPGKAWGPGDHSERFRGFYIDPERPVTHGNINYKPVDFQGADLIAVYRRDERTGDVRLVTMYPEPVKERNK
ncbi:hypothetical protein ABT095_34755 [Kitasatospora sp. NPDC002227]|uniref:hypothetical protein n=1 Tax=Kitasatospora sp. NPDC002227 TaxID=3154773 RepID=UPI00332C365C